MIFTRPASSKLLISTIFNILTLKNATAKIRTCFSLREKFLPCFLKKGTVAACLSQWQALGQARQAYFQ